MLRSGIQRAEFPSGYSRTKELLEKTVARHCACEGHVDSLTISPKGQLMVPSFESLLHGDALLHQWLQIYISRRSSTETTWICMNKWKHNENLPHEKPSILAVPHAISKVWEGRKSDGAEAVCRKRMDPWGRGEEIFTFKPPRSLQEEREERERRKQRT